MIAIIEGIGANLTSVRIAMERLSKKYILTKDPRVIQAADQVILPGVGTAAHGMKQLRESQLIELIPTLTQPVLGICLGMQLLFSHSEEDGVDCLKIIPNNIKRFPSANALPIPHMGWNQIHFNLPNHSLFAGIQPQSYFYFVHSYYASLNKYTLASTTYGINFSAIIQYSNFYGMQFHPEKSGSIGEQLLKNFFMLARKRSI